MKRSILVAILGVTTALTAATEASAAGRWPNWYVGLHGALDYVGESTVNDNPVVSDFSSDFGFGYGAAVGYRPATDNKMLRNMRFEAEWHQQSNDISEVNSTVGAFTGDGDTTVSAFMANVYYDFVTMDQYHQPKPFVPYIGAGLGIASFKMENAGLSLGNITNSDDLLAWQLLAGLSYSPTFMPFTEWNIGYRFFNTTEASFTYIAGNNFSVDYSSHNLEAGVRFLF